MSKEAIARVLEAEERANEIREEATLEARARVEARENAAAAKARADIAAATAEMKARTDTVRTRAGALIVRSREEAEADVEALREAAQDHMREAVKYIEWELTNI